MRSLRLVLLLLIACRAALADGTQSVEAARLDARVASIAQQLRCPVCPNQTIADSDAPVAIDLKAEIREQLNRGRSDAEVVDLLVQRYGDFVRYQPRFSAATALLWSGPFLLLIAALGWVGLTLRRHSRGPETLAAAAPPQHAGVANAQARKEVQR